MAPPVRALSASHKCKKTLVPLVPPLKSSSFLPSCTANQSFLLLHSTQDSLGRIESRFARSSRTNLWLRLIDRISDHSRPLPPSHRRLLFAQPHRQTAIRRLPSPSPSLTASRLVRIAAKQQARQPRLRCTAPTPPVISRRLTARTFGPRDLN